MNEVLEMATGIYKNKARRQDIHSIRTHRVLFFTGCFCKEPIKRLNEIVVTEIEITDEEYKKIMDFINTLNLHIRIYNYISCY